MEEKAIKHDAGKPQMEFISHIFLFGMSKALAFGAKKYSGHNWRKGLAYSRCFNSLMRHVWAWWGGEELDTESGLSHLDHAACCLMFLRELSETHKQLDDRWVIARTFPLEFSIFLHSLGTCRHGVTSVAHHFPSDGYCQCGLFKTAEEARKAKAQSGG